MTLSAFRLILFSVALLIMTLPGVALPREREDSIVGVVETASKAIVNIKTEEWSKKTSEKKGNDLLKRFFRPDNTDEEMEATENIGSGVVVDPRGIIVTNEHLVSKAVNIRVKFTSRQEAEADVLATDPELDIALLRVRETNDDFPYLKLTRKKPVRVGERAIVIGNPYGLSSSVTTGVISALERRLRINDNKVYANLIQTDAAINPGNSGGALLDGSGNLLGIVTAIYEEGKGIGFAIPIDEVISMLSEFLETEGKRPLLGIFIERRKEERSAYLSVNRIIPGSPAERYGLKVGDRIVEINKKKIKEGVKLSTLFRQATADGEVRCRISRGGEFYTVDINMKDIEEYMPSPVEEKLCGMRLSDIRGYARLKFKVRAKNGVVVTRIYKGGIGERYGLRAGDVILKINNRETMDKEHFQSLMVEGLRRNYILYQVKRNGNIFLLPIKLDVLL